MAIAYTILSFMEIFGFGKRDIFGGLMLLVISATYFASIKEVTNGDYKGISFLVVGVFLSFIFAVLYALILFADWLEFLLGNSEFILYIRGEIWMAFAVLPLAYLIKREIKEIRW